MKWLQRLRDRRTATRLHDREQGDRFYADMGTLATQLVASLKGTSESWIAINHTKHYPGVSAGTIRKAVSEILSERIGSHNLWSDAVDIYDLRLYLTVPLPLVTPEPNTASTPA